MATRIWRILVIDDQQAEDVKELIQGNKVLLDDLIEVETCIKFSEAIVRLGQSKIDLIILDLKDDSIELETPDEDTSGEKVFNELKKILFTPVIFHTAYSKKVKHLENDFVKVVTRGDNPTVLRDAIKLIFETKLLHLIKHLEEEQRHFLWETVSKDGNSFSTGSKTDIVYLLARRWANILKRDSVKRFLDGSSPDSGIQNIGKVHPIELYIYPPIHPKTLAGDIFKSKSKQEYFVVLTPSCDFENNKIEYILLAKCEKVEKQKEFEDIKGYWQSTKNSIKGNTPKETPVKIFKSFVKGSKSEARQEDRYKYLPGTNFLPDLLIDFKQTSSIKESEFEKKYERIASMDSPFGEDLLSKYSRFFGRLGTPDLDIDEVYNRVEAKYNTSKNS